MLVRQQRGVSLVESMIALLVISIGLLGIAALQITSVKQNTSALNHSQAVWLSYDISDRIRANYGQLALYDGIDTNTAYTKNCTTGDCSAADMKESDAREWAAMVQQLPGGRGMISTPSANRTLIRVMWDDEGNGATGITCGGAVTDLTCYEVTLVQ